MDVSEKNGRRKKWIVVVIGLTALLAAYFGLCVLAKGDRLLPQMTVNGVAVGGMTGEEAVSALEGAVQNQRDETVLEFSFEGDTYQIDAGDALELDCRGVVKEALRLSQKNFFLRGGYFLRALIKGVKLEVLPEVDREQLEEALEESGLLGADSTIPSSYRVEGGQLLLRKGQTGRRVDEEKLLQVAEQAVLAGEPGHVMHCPAVDGVVEALDLEKIYEEVYQEAADARLELEPGGKEMSSDTEEDTESGEQAVSSEPEDWIVPSVTGVEFDLDKAQSALDAAAEGDEAVIDLSYTEPEVSTQDLKEHLFADVLAEFSTGVGGSANRRENIRLATEKCNGIILNAGDVFSFNDTVGEQTAETGFKKANAILNNQIIQAYGGGICQVSTTIFEAALYAALEIPERWWHTFISSYAEPGMDAAVAWDALDLKVKNNTKYPVKLLVSYENGRLTAVFLGTKTEETPVEIETEVLDHSDGLLKMMTYRKLYSPDKSHFFREEIGYSEYLNSKERID